MRILASQENASDSELLCVADTMLSLDTEVLARTNPTLERILILLLSPATLLIRFRRFLRRFSIYEAYRPICRVRF